MTGLSASRSPWQAETPNSRVVRLYRTSEPLKRSSQSQARACEETVTTAQGNRTNNGVEGSTRSPRPQASSEHELLTLAGLCRESDWDAQSVPPVSHRNSGPGSGLASPQLPCQFCHAKLTRAHCMHTPNEHFLVYAISEL